MHVTTFDEFRELAQRGTFVPVYKEIVADLLTPVSAFLKIAEHSDYAFLLESVEGGEQVGRYSFLGKDPFLILRSRGGKTIIDRAGQTSESDKPFIAARARADGGLSFAVRAGSAALHRRGRRLPRLRRRGLVRARRRCSRTTEVEDEAGFMLFDTVLAFDHVRHRILIIANARITGDEDLESLYQFARAKIEFVERELERTLSKTRAGPTASRSPSRRTSRATSSRRTCARRRSTSPPAISTRSSSRSASRRGSTRTRSWRIARCGTSTRRPTCISSAWAAAPSSARRPRCWCASKGS